MAEAETETAKRTGEEPWIDLRVPEEDRQALLEHVDELEHTTVPYPLIVALGALLGVLVPLGLLFASL